MGYYRGGPRPDCLIEIGNALYWSCLMTDHGHEDQTCPFGELNLGVGLPNWGKTQMQHDNSFGLSSILCKKSHMCDGFEVSLLPLLLIRTAPCPQSS